MSDKFFLKKIHNKGQLTLFLGVSMLIVMGTIAFVVNVGLFVKAKINLQNAVDAAAVSGAAVQARHITNIAYLNWELRNNYKEWMFKYYILGQISQPKTHIQNIKGCTFLKNQDNCQTSPSGMNFRPPTIWALEGATGGQGPQRFDPFNIPSICIHFGESSDICRTFSVPGIPRFEASGLSNISDIHESFIDTIVSKKAQDCSERTMINYSTAMNWTFGTQTNIFAAQNESNPPPAIASNRAGAWPASIELAVRIRNLEMFVNRPPVDAICFDGQAGNCTTIDTLNSEASDMPPLNERPIKAFLSAFRNLGGDDDHELKQNLKVTEISPELIDLGNSGDSLSNFLIPSSHPFAREKRYLDLQIAPVNYAIFFTMFASINDKNMAQNISDGKTAESACTATKVALPAPGFITGFMKNPNVLTYYAVKAETKFLGLFFPFKDQTGITLKAYAAAKPFGGRIGPRLFDTKDNAGIIPRQQGNGNRSLPYVLGLDYTGSPTGANFNPGFPVPQTQDFWVRTAEDNIGGIPGLEDKAKFAIPNLIYDLIEKDLDNLAKHEESSAGAFTSIKAVRQLTYPKDEQGYRSVNESETRGLYDKDQFIKFAQNLAQVPGTTQTSLDPTQIEEAFKLVRRPTLYEALNYLIPTNTNKGDSLVSSSTPASVLIEDDDRYKLFAPLFGSGTLYGTSNEFFSLVGDFITKNEQAFNTYFNAMKGTADSIYKMDPNDPKKFEKAAKRIYENHLTECTSLAGSMHTFFFGHNAPKSGCEKIRPLVTAMQEYLSDEEKVDPTYFRGSYLDLKEYRDNSTFSILSNMAQDLLTAYVPGPRSGTGEDGIAQHPFSSTIAPLNEKRNSYSVKLIPIAKLVDAGMGVTNSYWDASIYSEYGNLTSINVLEGAKNFLNITALQSDFGGNLDH